MSELYIETHRGISSILAAIKAWQWVLLYALTIFLSLNRHAHSGRYNYHSEIWADKAGYNVYLPAVFCYGFEARRFPNAVDAQTGDGFRLNLVTNKVETKYSYGVALLQAPFWVVGHVLSSDKSGYSTAVHKAIDIAGATYLFVGVWFLIHALRRQFAGKLAFITVVLLVLGTNLWYYGIKETGMSHVYSFFAFALLMWQVGRAHIPQWGRRAGLGWEMLGTAITLGLISILRPLNLLVALPLLLWPALPSSNWRLQLGGILHWRAIGIMFLTVAICWVPQLLYYKYARGGYFVYSYGHEGFPYVFSPRFAELWFAPNNGALLYNPMLLLALVGIILLARRQGLWPAWLAALTWLLASYLYASWWAYALGCGYGGRGFVELYPILAWPLAALVANALANRRWVLGAVAVLLVAYNMHLSTRFDGCFYGKYDWDWQAYKSLLL